MANSVQIQKLSWWHERLADYMLAFPHATLGEIAQALGRTPGWISIVKNSDVFIDYWKTRSAAHSQKVTDEIKTKGFAVTELALDHLMAKLEGPAGELLPIETLLNVVDTNMKRFGYNDGGPQMPVFNFNMGSVTPEQLAEARARLRASNKPAEIDVKALPAPEEEPSHE